MWFIVCRRFHEHRQDMRSKTENSSFVGFQQKLQVIMEKPKKLFFIPRNLVWKATMWNLIKACVISGYSLEVDEKCALSGYRLVLVTKLSWPFSSYSPGIRFRGQKVDSS
jgi:hypothetical protein